MPRAHVHSMAGLAETRRISWLDGVRGIAILAVILVHSSQEVRFLPPFLQKVCESGQYGVQLFFVLSAITISTTLRSHLGRGESIPSWWARRAFRIAPMYYLGIAAYCGLKIITTRLGMHESLGSTDPIAILTNLLFLNAWFARGNNNVVPGGWSIGVEMSFYLAAPWLYLATQKWRRGALFLVVSALALLFAAYLRYGNSVPNNSFAYYSPLTQFPVMLTGVAFFALTQEWLVASGLPPGRTTALSLAALALAGLIFGEWCGVWAEQSHLLAPSLFGFVSCVFVALASGPLLPLVTHPFLTRCGVLSYSMYIVHFGLLLPARWLGRSDSFGRILPPSLQLIVFFLLGVAASAILAGVLRDRVEKPGIEFGRRIAARINRYRWPVIGTASVTSAGR